MLELLVVLGIAELKKSLEWLHPMALRNSEAILFHPRELVPGGLPRRRGQECGNKSSRRSEGLEGDGWGGSAYSHKAASQTNLDESPQHLAQPLSTRGAYRPPSMWSPAKLCATYHDPSDK